MYLMKLTEESSSRSIWAIDIEYIEARLTTLEFTGYGHSKLVWVARLTEVNLWADETNRPIPAPLLCALGF